VHSFVERQLVERVGDAGRRLHTGRSRNEQVSLDLRLYCAARFRCCSARWPTSWPRSPIGPRTRARR
jgi:argininosuccinate lyase